MTFMPTNSAGAAGQPDIQDLMRQLRFQSAMSNVSGGMRYLSSQLKGQQAPPPQMRGAGPLDMMKIEATLAEIESRKHEREREQKQTFARDALAAGSRYDPVKGILWNQPPRPDTAPRAD